MTPSTDSQSALPAKPGGVKTAPAFAPQRRVRIVVNVAITAALLALLVGISAPMLTLKKLVWISNTFSLLSGVAALWSEGQYLLFLIIGGFSVVFPLLKIALLYRVWNTRAERLPLSIRYFRWLAALGRWSMLDVFVVAVLLASVKLGALASVEVHFGLYAFALAVVLTMMVTHRVTHYAHGTASRSDSER